MCIRGETCVTMLQAIGAPLLQTVQATFGFPLFYETDKLIRKTEKNTGIRGGAQN